MTIAVGERLPDAKLFELTDDGPVERTVAEIFDGRTVALFGVPGAFTPTCHNKHLPSFVDNASALREAGVDDIVCVSVTNAHVMAHWGRECGASEAGIRMIGDRGAELVHSMGLSLDASPLGLTKVSRRFSALVRDREVVALNVEDSPGEAKVSTAVTMLEQLRS